jgi:hypothetical protein
MKDYKGYLSYFTDLPLTTAEIDGKTKYFTCNGLLFDQDKYETKPRVVSVYYSRYLDDSLMYKEFDVGAYIKNQFRSNLTK